MRTFPYILTISIFLSCSTKSKLVAPAKLDGKYGFIDIRGKWYIDPIFDSVGTFYNNYCDVYYKGKNGLINSKGKVIIDYKYDFIGNVENDKALVLINDKYNFVLLNGNLLSKTYFEDAEDFKEGLAAVKLDNDGKWGYINENGNLQIDTLYSYVSDFKNGKAKVEIKNSEFFIDFNGKVLNASKEENRIKTQKFSLIGYANNGTLGKVNQLGDTIMKKKYKAFGYTQDGKFWFNQNEKFGVADTSGNIIIKPEYDYLTSFGENGLAVAKKNKKYGFIDKNGKVIINFQFENADNFKYNLAKVQLNGKWGFINAKGNFVIQAKFEKITHQFRPINARYDPMYKYSD